MSHETLIHERVALARTGQNPTVIGRTAAGWAVLGDTQRPLGYCLILPDPVVPSINSLTGAERAAFLADMVGLGDALLEVTGAYRINYEILGNTDPALHAHVFARYTNEGPERVRGPVWMTYSADELRASPFEARVHAPLLAALRASLERAGLIRPSPGT
jgi:diadenosine tetraphosphate (Ap4A) HIT family hydrolase